MFRLTGFFGVDDVSVIGCSLDPGEKRCMSAASVYNLGHSERRISGNGSICRNVAWSWGQEGSPLKVRFNRTYLRVYKYYDSGSEMDTCIITPCKVTDWLKSDGKSRVHFVMDLEGG